MSSGTPNPKLTSLTTSTLSLLLERQRLQSTHPYPPPPTNPLKSAHTSQGDDGGVEALRGQFERLRGMLGEEEAENAGLESIPIPAPLSPTPPASPLPHEWKISSEPMYEPYTDDPDPAPELDEGGIMLQQRHIMEGALCSADKRTSPELPRIFLLLRTNPYYLPYWQNQTLTRPLLFSQDTHLDHLSSSIGRQHHISLQINDELEVHTGLLESLDSELDGTDARMTSARKRLARVARGAKENGTSRPSTNFRRLTPYIQARP
ncbi:syntaxin-like protein [Melanogaster broomeanus]|nr:syntaxin-like protein [Melanogaster broomeanus]